MQSDHGIEQENHTMKVLGGVKGLLTNKTALHRFGLVAPELNRICDEFLALNNITRHGRSQHYQLTGSTNKRIKDNVEKLTKTMDTLDVIFSDANSVYNLVSKSVLCENAENDVINHSKIRTEMYIIPKRMSNWHRNHLEKNEAKKITDI